MKDNLAIGLELLFNLARLNFKNFRTYNSETGFYEDKSEPKESSIGFSPFQKYFFFKQAAVSFYVQGNFLMLVNSSNIIEKGYLIRTDVQVKGFGGNLSAGIVVSVARAIKLEFSLPFASFFHQSYFDEQSKYNYDKKNNVNVFPNILTPTLGFSGYF